MAVLDYLGSIFQEFERLLTESDSDLNFEYEDGILKAGYASQMKEHLLDYLEELLEVCRI